MYAHEVNKTMNASILSMKKIYRHLYVARLCQIRLIL